jgi:hypothetical protein
VIAKAAYLYSDNIQGVIRSRALLLKIPKAYSNDIYFLLPLGSKKKNSLLLWHTIYIFLIKNSQTGRIIARYFKRLRLRSREK